MQPTEHSNLKAKAREKLEHQLGQLVKSKDAEGPLMVALPGLEYPVHIFAHAEPVGSFLRIGCPVTSAADWSSGLSEFLVRESGNWVFGRPERWESGIVIEHSVFPDISGEQLATIVLGLADTAIRLERDLYAMGGLASPTAEGLDEPA